MGEKMKSYDVHTSDEVPTQRWVVSERKKAHIDRKLPILTMKIVIWDEKKPILETKESRSACEFAVLLLKKAILYRDFPILRWGKRDLSSAL